MGDFTQKHTGTASSRRQGSVLSTPYDPALPDAFQLQAGALRLLSKKWSSQKKKNCVPAQMYYGEQRADGDTGCAGGGRTHEGAKGPPEESLQWWKAVAVGGDVGS